MSTIDNHSLSELGSKPVSDDSPCGENARYESEFEQLEAELAKQESLTAATVDWGRVVDLSASILEKTSKDLLVGAYLCYGLLIKEGYSGLAVGLKVLNDMVESHWDCLFPPAKRMRARATAFSWLAEKAGLILAEKTPTAGEAQTVIDTEKLLRQLDGNLVEKMGDQAPMLTDLSRPLKNFKNSAEAEIAKAAAPEPEPVPPAPTAAVEEAPSPAQPAAPAQPTVATPPPMPTPPPAASKASAPELASGEPQSENDSKKAIRQVQTALRNTASFHLSQKLADPKGYRLTRVATWLAVDKAPPANDGVTQVVAPQAERLKVFEGKIDKGDFAAVILELEKTIARSPFWLDGHFMVVKALRGLGAEYEAAVDAVIGEVSALLARIPELIELCFNDSTPFASDQTRLWLDAEVLVSASGAEGSATATTGASGEAWVEALEQAGKVAAGGDSDQALQIMNDGLRSAGSQREQVYWRCALAQLLLQIGRADAAASLLEQIVAQLDEEQLARWEPAAAAQIYRLLYQTYQKQQKKSKDDKALADKADAAYRKLCWFDPVNALSVKGG